MGASMGDFLLNLLGAIATSAYLVAICTLCEKISPREPFRWRDRTPGFYFGQAMTPFSILMSIPLASLYELVAPGAVVRLPLNDWVGPVGAAIILLMMTDFLKYWEHRFEHRFLWRVHAVHHSVEHLSAATSYAHPLQYVPMFFMIAVPLSLVDVGNSTVPMTVAILVSLMEFLIHSPTRVDFGPARRVLVDPPFHRIHHSREPVHFDRNFGVLFSIWDQMFGTAHMPRKDEWPAVGIHERSSPRSLLDLLLFPWRMPKREEVVDVGVPAEEIGPCPSPEGAVTGAPA